MELEIRGYTIYQHKQVGKGQFGVVLECSSKNLPNENLCVKVVNNIDQVDESTVKEIQILQRIKDIKNNHLVKVYDVFEDKQKFFMVMERCSGGDMKKLIDDKQKAGTFFTAKEILSFIYQFVDGYEVLYRNNIMHRDIKPQNIFLNQQGEFKIGDLGAGRILQNVLDKKNYTKIGSPVYSSPEIHQFIPFSSKTDVYSFGMVIYQMAFLRFPFEVKLAELNDFIRKLKDTAFKIQDLNIEGQSDAKKEITAMIEGSIVFCEDNRLSWETIFQRVKSNPIYNEFRHLGLIESKKIIVEEQNNNQNEQDILTSSQQIQINNKINFEETLSTIPKQQFQQINPIKSFLTIQTIKVCAVVNTLDYYIKCIQIHSILPSELDHYCLVAALLGFKLQLLQNMVAIFTGTINQISQHLLRNANSAQLQQLLYQFQTQQKQEDIQQLKICQNEIQSVQQHQNIFSDAIRLIDLQKIKFTQMIKLKEQIQSLNRQIDYYSFWESICFIKQSQFSKHLKFNNPQELYQMDQNKLFFIAYLKIVSEIEKLYPQHQLEIESNVNPQFINFTQQSAIQYVMQN